MRSASATAFAISLSVAIFAQSGTPALAQAPGEAGVPVIKTGTQLVVIDVVVTDANGRPVKHLSKEQFHLREGDHEQSLKVFDEHDNAAMPVVQLVNTPSEIAAGRASNAGQQVETTAYSVVLLDALNTTNADMSFARDQVRNVIRGLPVGSRLAIFVLSSRLHLVQGFTNDTAQLEQALAGQRSPGGPLFNDPDMVLLAGGPAKTPGGRSVATLASGSAASDSGAPRTYLRSTAAQDEEILSANLREAKTIAAFETLIRYLTALPGKKNLVWVAGSFPLDFSVRELSLQMQAGHIAVYPVDARGLTGDTLFGAAGAAAPSPDQINESAMARLQQQQVMDNIARETGGHAVYNNNDIAGAITQSLNGGANYYTLGYSPADKNWNGKYRKIDIETDRSDVKLSYRRGYFAVDPAKSSYASSDHYPKFSSAMLRGAPEMAEIGLAIQATPTGNFVEEKNRKPPSQKLPFPVDLKGRTEIYSVDCTIRAADVQFTRTADGKLKPTLTFTLLAYDGDGKILNAEIGEFGLPLNEAQYKAVVQSGLTVNRKIELPVGQVFLRVGVHDLQNEKVGATELPLTVARKDAPGVK